MPSAQTNSLLDWIAGRPADGLPWVGCPGLGTLRGLPSGDGHVLLYMRDRATVSDMRGYQLIVGGGGLVQTPAGGWPDPPASESMVYRWPTAMLGVLRNHLPTRYAQEMKLYAVWDGNATTGNKDYSIAAGTFYAADYARTGGADAWPTLNPPVTLTTAAPPPPSCQTVWLYPLIARTGGTVPLGSVSLPAACSAGGCSRHNIAGLASSSVGIRCDTPAGYDKSSTQAVKPRLTFAGQTTGDSGPYLLQSSQTGVFVWGQTGGGLNGCNYWGQSGVAETYHPVPFNGVTRWRGDWDATSGTTGWINDGTRWQSNAIQINWGLCVDTSAGSGRSVQAGPFTATATYTIHLD